MALPAARNDRQRVRNARGSALIEAVPVMFVILAFFSGLLLATYLLFARAWIQWQSEQALYCVAVEENASLCQQQLQRRLKEFLFWGVVHSNVSGANAQWDVEVRWVYDDYKFQIHKSLNPRRIVRSRALQW